MKKQKRNDYIMEIQTLYNQYLEKTENRGISYGELSYIENLKKKELDSLYIELIENLEEDQ